MSEVPLYLLDVRHEEHLAGRGELQLRGLLLRLHSSGFGGEGNNSPGSRAMG